ncbi:polysaccharide biosynthesis tyrosine autokinase [Flavobacterium sp. MAH-1]|uniref:non-specific protein-tyrosine kinase n=1 Tax=Flavobacterium agri TaxID=2743471 RepID=A0A7Y8Y1R1_9FLAO|nr:polysaccharide biosynthesis tyrosine autokinase [Flavobacterium agri]NUY80863.1 polysaccharide biosynthesis tyrosine autokinase [Flavobacterium agri]NYA70887.1 polysaccharide biosynthesis tyrosine autokinase [Flavobacterium agri]
MLDTKDFSILDSGKESFDFKGFLIKTLSYWKWFLLSLVVCFFIAHQVNIRKEKVFGVETTISVKEENNQLFTSNTSLVFNWGGISDEVQGIAFTLKSRTHNEKVVDSLDYYIDYLQQSEYYMQDVYGEVPFRIVLDKKNAQIFGSLIGIKFVSPTVYEIEYTFKGNSVPVVYYNENKIGTINVEPSVMRRRYKVGQMVDLPFLHFSVELKENPEAYLNNPYFIRFNHFDEVVLRYQGIRADIDEKAGSILRLSLQGSNKARMVEYLNTTVGVLIKDQLDHKNQFALNTINFIDKTLEDLDAQLTKSEGEIKDFSRGKNLSDIENTSDKFSGQLLEYDTQRDGIYRKIAYLNSLKSYLQNSVDFSKLIAPTSAGIDDANINANVSQLVALSIQRSKMAYAVHNEKAFRDYDKDIEAVKRALLENIKAVRSSVDYDLNLVQSKIGKVESTISQLPEDKQEYFRLKRKFDLNANVINTFMAKRLEARIIKESNISDIHFIDSAKDVGSGLIGPNTSVNYVMAFFLGLLIPLIFIFAIFFLENAILNTDDITRFTKIPLIGVVGIKSTKSNLAVFEKPKSALAESFRAIRSSLQFLYKKRGDSSDAGKTLMLTSSVSGEGKTFCSINIATVFAMSEKKTVIVGLDLRKPKIFDDFKVRNEIGVVNYLIGQKSLAEVIQSTHIPFLDVITSGPIPPNPSELIISEAMHEFVRELKSKYDYVIFDTPPVGLVADALELAQFADVTLYIMRQNYTKKEMVLLLNNRFKRGELNNVSIVFNGYQNKAKYGSGYGYGYGYSYADYSEGYHEEDKPQGLFRRFLNLFGRR